MDMHSENQFKINLIWHILWKGKDSFRMFSEYIQFDSATAAPK
jgi:hypothetical protein